MFVSLKDFFETLKWSHVFHHLEQAKNLCPVVQSIISLTSFLVFKMLSVLVSTISNSQVFLLKKKKMWVAFANAKATNIFSAKLLAYMPYLMIKVLTIC